MPRRRKEISKKDDEIEGDVAEIIMNSKSFDFLADEPDIYSI